MAQEGAELDRETFSCPICLDLMKDPVTIPCGHSYCMSCIGAHWNSEGEQKIHSCPQCRQMFTLRPVLVRNTMLADLMDKLKKTGTQVTAADHCCAGPEDVACDVCTGRKLKAVKSCLNCVASYCETHLQPHYDAAPLQKHKLVEPSEKPQENICPHHDEVMKMFCRTDQHCICYLCSVDEHKGHDMVSAAAERAQRQRELEATRQEIQQRIKDKERDVKVLQQEAEAISRSADEAMENTEKIVKEVILLMEKMRSDMKQQITHQQETEVKRVKELQQRLEQEITELRRKDSGLEKMSRTDNHSHFLQNCPSLSKLSDAADRSSNYISPLCYFEDVTGAMLDFRDKLQNNLREEWTNVSQVLLPQHEPKTRGGFLKYLCEITLDPNTARTEILLSEGNKKAKRTHQVQNYTHHADRFSYWGQVLSKTSLSGRCYWEVEWSGTGVCVAVSYKDIERQGSSNECRFGYNNKSWAINIDTMTHSFCHNSVSTPMSGPPASRIGVYLDHRAGILSFYSVSDNMTLLHRVHTTFTQPLYAGLGLYSPHRTAQFSELK